MDAVRISFISALLLRARRVSHCHIDSGTGGAATAGAMGRLLRRHLRPQSCGRFDRPAADHLADAPPGSPAVILKRRRAAREPTKIKGFPHSDAAGGARCAEFMTIAQRSQRY